MSNLFIAISDVHISLKNLDVAIIVLRQALSRAKQLNVPLFISGDLNDGKAAMRSEWVNALIDLFDEYKEINIHVLIGNHDLQNKNSNDSSLYFLKYAKNITLYDLPTITTFNGVHFGIIPYMPTQQGFRDAIKKMREDNVKNLIVHQGFYGSYMGEYVVDESSVKPEEVEDFNIVLSGHYHRSQLVGKNIRYFGSPFTVSFGEANEEKFIWVVEQFDGKVFAKPEQTNVRRHYQLEFTEQSVMLEKPTYPDGSLLKVVVKGTREFVKSQTLEKFKARFPNVASISIVPDIEKQSEHRISSDIIHNPMLVIDSYLSQSNSSFDKVALKNWLLSHCEDVFKQQSSRSNHSFKIVSVEAENVLSFKKLSFSYSPMGLTLLEGYDEDLDVNTGTGKSSFLDVPVYGIFGETSKNLKSDEVINRHVGKNLSVITTLQCSDGVYKIHRYRKHHEKENDLFLLAPNGQEIRGKDNRETQKIIEETIGCSFDVFLKSSYFTQFGSIDRFLSSSDTDKKKLISEITDLSVYDNIGDLIKKKIVQYESEQSRLLNEIDKIKSNLSLLNNEKTLAVQREQQWEVQHQFAVDELKLAISQYESKKKTELEVLQQKMAAFDVDIQSQISVLKDKESLLEKQEVERKLECEKLIDKYTTQIAQHKKRIEELSSLPKVDFNVEKQEIEKKLKAISELNRNISSLEGIKQFKQSEIASILNKIKQEENKINGGSGSQCSYCHQDISVDHISKHIDIYNSQMAEAQSESDKAQVQINTIQKAIDTNKPILDDRLKQISLEEKKVVELEFELKNEQRSVESLSSLINSEIEKKNLNRINIHSVEIEKLNNLENPYVIQIDRLKNSQCPEEIELQSVVKQHNPFKNSWSHIDDKIKSISTELSTLEINTNLLKEQLGFAQWWKTAINTYIKSYLMDSCLESINAIADQYLNTLFDGVLKFHMSAITERGSEIKEKIAVQIVNNGDECSYQSLSGGERCRICLAVNLALAEVIGKSTGKRFNMIFLDEILNGLDESGKAQSMRLLKELESKYETIFVIDHADGFKQLFSNSILIKKKDKASFVV